MKLPASRFPDPREADDDGLLCYGGDLEIETLLDAYSHGVFPWPQEGLPLLWFSPMERGVLDFSEVHWPRRFLRELRSRPMKITFDQDFSAVIKECASVPRKPSGQPTEKSPENAAESNAGTWILPQMQDAYRDLHRMGYAHSVECWDEQGRLVGGLYGVHVAGVFSGESMFHHVDGASKRCLFSLIEKLSGAGLTWIDIQMVTPVLKSFGGKYISRDEFLNRLDLAHQNAVSLKPFSVINK